MSRCWNVLLLLVGVQALLSGVALWLERTGGCGACRAGGFSWAFAGFIVYTGLFVSALCWGQTRILFAGLLLGFGVHAALSIQLLLNGLVCGLCFAAAGVSLVLTVLSIACDRGNLGRLALLLPWSVLLVAARGSTLLTPGGGLPKPMPEPGGQGDPVQITVFTQPDCPHCHELQHRVMPGIEREFGSRIQVSYRPAADLPAVRRVPTLIVSRPRREERGRVIEGLPSEGKLREAIHAVEGRP